jgi:hypothetical protein
VKFNCCIIGIPGEVTGGLVGDDQEKRRLQVVVPGAVGDVAPAIERRGEQQHAALALGEGLLQHRRGLLVRVAVGQVVADQHLRFVFLLDLPEA